MSDAIIRPEAIRPPSSDARQAPVERRSFLNGGVMAAVGACYAAALGYPIYRYLGSPVERAASSPAVTEVVLEGAQSLAAGAALMFRFGTKPALLIHHADNSWVAFDAVCTHLGCTVEYEPDRQRIHCACHDGVYDAQTGRNVSGPPPRPLARFAVQVGEGKVVVSREQA